MLNGLWLQAGAPSPEQIAKYKAANFGFVAVQVGDQKTDGSIVEVTLPGEIAHLIAVMHEAGIKVYGWIQSNIRSPADLSAGSRPRYLAAISGLMKKYNFDGLVSNVEARANSNHVDFADFLNEVTGAMHSLGRIHITSMVAGDGELFEKAGVFSSLKLDYLSPMLYDGPDYWTAATFKYFLAWYLTYSPCPVLPGLIAWDSDGRSLKAKMDWIDEWLALNSAPELAGFKVFWNATLRPGDWVNWDAWPVKDGVAAPTPEPIAPAPAPQPVYFACPACGTTFVKRQG